MKLAKSILAVAAALACGIAMAADDKAARKGFNDMDKNKDGKLSRAEAAGNKDLLAKWKDADADNDGTLTRVEYLKVMAVADANTVRNKVTGNDKEKKSSQTARNERENKGFNDMDKNKDGKLSRTEAAGNKDLVARWKEADADNDGTVTRAEYLKVMAKQDANRAKTAVSKETNEAKRRAPDASTGSTTQKK
jgi:Ca2+-binding EF-hand superfamily protein